MVKMTVSTMWLHFLLVLVTIQITNSDSSLNGTHSDENIFNGTHRIIKRYTHRQHFHYDFPKPPRIPTLSRPAIPLFPMFGGPPPGHRHEHNGNGAFPNIILRPPSDENLFTEEEDEDDEGPKRKEKKKKKAKGNKRPPQSQSESESVEDEKDLHAKGESGELTKLKGNGKRTPSFGTTARPMTHADRTLLAAKNALLVKKAIIAKAVILTKLKKAAKLAKVKGVSVKAPGVVFSVGSPNNVQASSTSASDEDDEDAADDMHDAMEEEEAEDDNTDSDRDSVEIRPTTMEMANMNMSMIMANSDSSNETMMMGSNKTMKQQYTTNSMMQQLQAQLQQKQQQQQMGMMTPAQAQKYNQMQPLTLEQYQQQGQLTPAQVQQYQQQYQQPGVTVDVVLPQPSPAEIEFYKGSKGAKKAKKKAKKKQRPRPVNLGVKANLYKKFDQLAKKAQSKLSTFIQIDVDFLARRNNNKFASRTLEVSAEEGGSNEKSGTDGGAGNFQSPGNVPPPWIQPEWRSEYPERTGNPKINCGDARHCDLKPVWILLKRETSSDVL